MEDCRTISSYGVPGLVSIIIPTHNRGDLILETLQSIINQDYNGVEIIVVDDHSDDNTDEVLYSFIDNSKKYPIYYVKSDRYGACAARNLGLSHSNGEFIQFFDDDDVMGINHISKKVDMMLLGGEYDFVACNFSYFESCVENIVGNKRIDDIPHSIESHLLNMAFPTPAYFFRRDSIIKLGLWDELCLKCQDVRYYHRLFLYEMNGCWLPDFLFYVRTHSNSITGRYSIKVLSSTIATFNSIEKEWVLKCSDKSKIDKVKRVVVLNKLSFSYLAFSYNYCFWGIKMMLNTFFSRPKDSVRLFMLYIRKMVCKSQKSMDIFYDIK